MVIPHYIEGDFVMIFYVNVVQILFTVLAASNSVDFSRERYISI